LEAQLDDHCLYVPEGASVQQHPVSDLELVLRPVADGFEERFLVEGVPLVLVREEVVEGVRLPLEPLHFFQSRGYLARNQLRNLEEVVEESVSEHLVLPDVEGFS